MLRTELRSIVRSILEDPSGFRFTDTIIDRYTTEALRRVERSVGLTQRRLTLSLVESQQEYLLPVAGVLRVLSVDIIPEDGSPNSSRKVIQQVDFNDIPVDVVNETDPYIYAIDIASGTNSDQMALIMYPPPARSTADSIVVTYDGDFVTESQIPFPPTFDMIIARLTSAGCLSESEDETSIRKGEYLRELAEGDLRDMTWMSSMSKINTERFFP